MVKVNKKHPKTGKKQVCIDKGEIYKFSDGTIIDKNLYDLIEKEFFPKKTNKS